MSVERSQYVVIGAGPAGLQMAYHLKQAGRSCIVLEAGQQAGAFFLRHPRHRKLISSNKIHTGYADPEINLRWDWNSLLEEGDDRLLFSKFSQKYFPPADAMLDYLAAYARKHALPVRYDCQVRRIEREGEDYLLDTSQGPLACQVLIVAAGVQKDYLPPIDGIELAEHYVRASVAADDYRGQRVLVIGKGNSAFETADNLVETASMIHVASPNPLKMAWSTHYVGHLRAVNNNLLDTYQLKSQNAIIDATIESIRRVDGRLRATFRYAHAQDEVESIDYDRIIACTGFALDTRMFGASAMPRLCINDRFPEQTEAWESTNQRNMFFAGTLMQMRDFKKQMSGFIHGFRYNVRTLHRLLEERFHQVDYPSAPVKPGLDGVQQAILARINRTSALWQQPGFLCDVVLLKGGGASRAYVEELPFEVAAQRYQGASYLTVSLEFGATKYADPFAVSRVARDNHMEANRSNFLHPVVRHYEDGVLRSEHHVIEDLAAEWVEPEHTEPLRRYLEQVLAPRTEPSLVAA
ncbi:NAD(P)-binding domain-containing protein [Aquabacterium sp. A7-Y]|uniref:NAD(P)-binding domain-containing protein n=1 Tax=Aquabacterium sp. A7-Y TaxID=1349605 RepID=UPI00223C926D|nr:NAD(P)-binding domain-containing protein [Aquabacterium sp. A7-Y]MCW7536897.1 NAD(P)-binding domain-containing protein [Aquabacterium sp. A7-Y]